LLPNGLPLALGTIGTCGSGAGCAIIDCSA
jgi:hypothetical protein